MRFKKAPLCRYGLWIAQCCLCGKKNVPLLLHRHSPKPEHKGSQTEHIEFCLKWLLFRHLYPWPWLKIVKWKLRKLCQTRNQNQISLTFKTLLFSLFQGKIFITIWLTFNGHFLYALYAHNICKTSHKVMPYMHILLNLQLLILLLFYIWEN